MPRSQGTYTLPPIYQATPGTEIRSEQHNAPLEDIAQAITGSVARDGSSPMLADLPMNGRRVRNLGAATSPGDAVRLDQVPVDITPGSGLTFGAGDASRTLSLQGQALALHNATGVGLFARTGSGAPALRTLIGGTGINIAAGNGGPADPTISAAIASTAQARAGTANNVLMTPLRVEEAGLPGPRASGSLNNYYDNRLTITHGLGRHPRLVQWYLECLTANNGYAVGDRIILPAGTGYTEDNYDIRSWASTTQVSAVVRLVQAWDKTGTTSFSIASGLGGAQNWRLVGEVW